MSSPLLRIRAGIEAGNANEVVAGVQQADSTNVTLAANVRDMITQWLKVNAPEKLPAIGVAIPVTAAVPASNAAPVMSPPMMTPPSMSPPSMTPPSMMPPKMTPPAGRDEEGIKAGAGKTDWSSSKADVDSRAQVGRSRLPPPEMLRKALLRFFEGAPKGSDAALGLGIIEDTDGSRYLPFSVLGKAVGLSEEDDDIVRNVQRSIVQAQSGIFSIAPDGSGAGLLEWAGWEDFASALAVITAATRDPAFEPRSIQRPITRCARGAVSSGNVRQADVLSAMQDSLSPQDMPEDAAPALRSAISRRARLALACLVDAIAAAGLAPEAGPDAMGLVGQLPRTLFGLIFDQIDDRDRGACAFLAEILLSWDRRRCFSKRWLQDASSKFTSPKGTNSERDEGKGWYALKADASRLQVDKGHSSKSTNGGQADRDGGREAGRDAGGDEARSKNDDPKHAANKRKGIVQDEEDDDTVNKHLEDSRKRRASLMAKYSA